MKLVVLAFLISSFSGCAFTMEAKRVGIDSKVETALTEQRNALENIIKVINEHSKYLQTLQKAEVKK